MAQRAVGWHGGQGKHVTAEFLQGSFLSILASAAACAPCLPALALRCHSSLCCADPPQIALQVHLVMQYCDMGTLEQAVRRGDFHNLQTSQPKLVREAMDTPCIPAFIDALDHGNGMVQSCLRMLPAHQAGGLSGCSTWAHLPGIADFALAMLRPCSAT